MTWTGTVTLTGHFAVVSVFKMKIHKHLREVICFIFVLKRDKRVAAVVLSHFPVSNALEKKQQETKTRRELRLYQLIQSRWHVPAGDSG